MTTFGVGCSIASEHPGGWRVELVLDNDRERELLPDQPFVGFGATKSAAGLDAASAYIRALHKLPREVQESLEKSRPDDARLLGAATSFENVETQDKNAARSWVRTLKEAGDHHYTEPTAQGDSQ